jgi:hypothetical protein
MLEMAVLIDDIFEAAKDAGRQLAEKSSMYQETLDTVSHELLPLNMYIQFVKQYFREVLDPL